MDFKCFLSYKLLLNVKCFVKITKAVRVALRKPIVWGRNLRTFVDVQSPELFACIFANTMGLSGTSVRFFAQSKIGLKMYEKL